MLARLLLKLILCPSLLIIWSRGGASSIFIMRSSSWKHDTDLPYKACLSPHFLQLKDTDQCHHWRYDKFLPAGTSLLLCQNNVEEKISINWLVTSLSVWSNTLVGTCGHGVPVTQMKNDDQMISSVWIILIINPLLYWVFSPAPSYGWRCGDPWPHPSEMSEVIIVNQGAVFIISHSNCSVLAGVINR